jgi:glycosyltransferase involved in cell wall biosynthesis
MKIHIDTQTFNEQKFGGISRYHAEIINNLNRISSVQVQCPIFYSENLHLKEANLFRGFRSKFFDSKLIPNFIREQLVFKNKKADIEALKKSDFDVFVPSYYDDYFLDYLKNKPFVLTVYDLIQELMPQYFENDVETAKRKKILIENANRIIAISESTKADILKVYPETDVSKIDVVYLSQSITIKENNSLSLPKNYILFVGNRTRYKNFLFFLKAVAPLMKENHELFIVCAGGNRFIREEKKLIKELNLSDQIIQQNFEDNDLATYYKNAKCFVFPSEYEGFGIPVLEAMACGCPVVLANHSSFPEVAGDAGVYFELNNPDDLKNKIADLLKNDSLRKSYSEKGLAQEKKFSWQKTAADCLEVYKKAKQ